MAMNMPILLGKRAIRIKLIPNHHTPKGSFLRNLNGYISYGFKLLTAANMGQAASVAHGQHLNDKEKPLKLRIIKF